MKTESLHIPTHAGTPANDLDPAVGMPATYTIGSDTYAGFIVQVERGGRTVFFARTMDTPTDRWDCFTRRGNGEYRLRGCTCGHLYLGDTSPTDLDPSF